VPSTGIQKDQSGGTERCHNRRHSNDLNCGGYGDRVRSWPGSRRGGRSGTASAGAGSSPVCGQLADVVLDDIGQRPSQVRPGRLHRIQLAGVWRELVDVSARTGRRSARASRELTSDSSSSFARGSQGLTGSGDGYHRIVAISAKGRPLGCRCCDAYAERRRLSARPK
jgi:hypothetical protein